MLKDIMHPLILFERKGRYAFDLLDNIDIPRPSIILFQACQSSSSLALPVYFKKRMIDGLELLIYVDGTAKSKG